MTLLVFRPSRRGVAILVGAAAVLVTALATAAVASDRPALGESAPKPASAARWKALVAKAKAEGAVTFYGTQAPAVLADVAAKFKAKYGITVTVNRQVDNVLAQQITAEEGTGRAGADIWSSGAKRLVLGALKNGWVVDGVGPELFNKRYNRKVYTLGKANIIGLALLGMAWNTQLGPKTLNDIPDLLTPTFASGKLGVFNPSISPSAVDWYHWAERTYGTNFLPRLAAQHPKIYLGTGAINQAIESGEILGAPMAAGTALADKAIGAPIDYKIPNNGKGWNAPYYGMILKQAPHPAAAQLLVNYMISREGQAVLNAGYGAIYPNIPGTYYAAPNNVKLSTLTPAKIAAFQERWNALFTK
jgi:iron(III) transport system substrate-binding protein